MCPVQKRLVVLLDNAPGPGTFRIPSLANSAIAQCPMICFAFCMETARNYRKIVAYDVFGNSLSCSAASVARFAKSIFTDHLWEHEPFQISSSKVLKNGGTDLTCVAKPDSVTTSMMNGSLSTRCSKSLNISPSSCTNS